MARARRTGHRQHRVCAQARTCPACRQARSCERRPPADSIRSRETAGRMSPSIFFTARRTPLPPYLCGSPSLNSTASCFPVEAPDGACPTATTPFESVTRAATVGFPRESRISYPQRSSMSSGISFPNVSNGIGRIEDQVPGKGADSVFQCRVRDIFRRRFTVDSRQKQGAEVLDRSLSNHGASGNCLIRALQNVRASCGAPARP